jgi:hypothetical protein
MSCGPGKPETRCLGVLSISKSLQARLPESPVVGRVLSAFGRACIVEYAQDELLAIVVPELGNGPLNAVIGCHPEWWRHLQPGTPVYVQDDVVQLGGWKVALDGAETWEPCPDWDRLRASRGAVLGRLGRLMDRVDKHFAWDSLLDLFRDRGRSGVSDAGMVYTRARNAAEAMWEGWRGDEAQLRAGAVQLAGLGSGLTPAGDDFVLGTMLCAWLAHPNPARHNEAVARVCAPKTTMLSRAFLQAAAVGEFGAPWHRLLEALTGGSDERVEAATQEVLASGHSSGADALAGFLWMGLRLVQESDGPQAP